MPVALYSKAYYRKKNKQHATRTLKRQKRTFQQPFVGRALRAAIAKGREEGKNEALRVGKRWQAHVSRLLEDLDMAKKLAAEKGREVVRLRSCLKQEQSAKKQAKADADWEAQRAQKAIRQICFFLANASVAQRKCFHKLSKKKPRRIHVVAE